MPSYVKLSESDIHRIVVKRVSGGWYQGLVEASLQILRRDKGSYLSVEGIDDVLRGLDQLSSSVAQNIVRDVEEIYEEQQKKAA